MMDVMIATKTTMQRTRLILFFVIITLILKVATLQIVGVGGADPTETWQSAKLFPYDSTIHLFHRNVRFGTIIPVYITQQLFGTSPLVYYVAPVAAALLFSLFYFLILEMIFSTSFAFYTGLLINFLIEIIKMGSHPRVSTFSTMYFFVALYLIFRFQEKAAPKKTVGTTFFKNQWLLAAASLMTFFMYMAKEDSLFVLPVLFYTIWDSRRKLVDLLLYACPLAFMYLVETAIYFFFTDYKLGRLSVITSHTQSGDVLPIDSLRMLFFRYHPAKTDLYLVIIIIIAVIGGIYLLKRKNDKKLKSLLYIQFLYLFFLTFMIKSFKPLVPFNAFRERYFVLIIPIMFAIDCYLCCELYSYMKNKILPDSKIILSTFKREIRLKTYIISGSAIALAALLVFPFILKMTLYHNNDLHMFQTSPLYLVPKYQELINQASIDKRPIIMEGNSRAERFIPIIEEINGYIKQGMTKDEACKKFGIGTELFESYIAKLSQLRFRGTYFLERFFWDSHIYGTFDSLPEKTFNYQNKVYRIFYLAPDDQKKEISDFSTSIYVPYNPFQVIEINKLEDLEKY